MTPAERMRYIDELFSHVWMVRTFLKHSDEVEEDEELSSVHRTLYDVMHAVGSAHAAGDADGYLKQVKKKLGKLKSATNDFCELQPEISSHTNYQMAARSLRAALSLERTKRSDPSPRSMSVYVWLKNLLFWASVGGSLS